MPTLWESHLATPMPDECRGAVIEEIDLAVLAADATGGLQAYYSLGRGLTPGHIARLGLCYRDLGVAGRQLTGEARAYFLRLEVLMRQALEECAARPVAV